MATDIDRVVDFKTQFYNLEGVHYNERKKNFYKLLYSVEPNTLAQSDIEPRNYLERIFYVDILIYSKQTDKLMQVLKEGTGVLVSRILKQKWFFKEAFNNTTETSIVNDFLPTISFALRMKVLKKMALSFSKERMDNIFDCVLERYGLFIAAQFLFSCSSTKIIDVLRTNEVTLSLEQLKRLLDRDVSLLKVYFEEYERNKKTKFNDQDFLSYLVLKYPNLYFELERYVEDFPRVGRRTTKTLLKIDEEGVLKDFSKRKNRFNISALTRKVKNFDIDYLHELFPPSKDDFGLFTFYNTIGKFLKKYPQKNRWNIFSNAYKKAYNEDVLSRLSLLSWRLIEMFSDEIKMKWSEIKYKESNSITFLEYFEPEKGFLLIKNKLNVTSDAYDRSKMLQSSIKSCHAYKNYTVYEDVLKYIYVRHRNEEEGVRIGLLTEISNNIDYELTTESFWMYVNQLIDVFRVKSESLPYKNICQYLTFLLKKELPLDEAFEQFVKDGMLPNRCYWQFNYFSEPKIKGEAMKQVIKHLDVIDDPTKRQLATFKLLDEIVSFNMGNKDLWIDLNEFPAIIETIKSALKAEVFNDEEVACIRCLIQYNYCGSPETYLKVYEDGQLLNIVKRIAESKHSSKLSDELYKAVKKPRLSGFQIDLLDFYFTTYLPKHPNCFNSRQAKYFINEEPEIFAKYFDKVVDIECHRSILDYPVIKRFSHLFLDKKLITSLIPAVSREDSPSIKMSLVEKLSKVMTTDEFIDYISIYIPQKMKLDDMDEEEKKPFELQCSIVKALRNLDEFKKIIPLLHTFCQGDYLQSSIPLMYKVLYRISEEEAISFINVLADRAVSTRKHAVHLGFVVLSQNESVNIFNTVAAKEKNVSAKKYLLQGVLKYYLKNPSEYLLDMVIKSLAFVDENDTELISDLTDAIQKVYWSYKPIFFEHVWNFLDDMAKKDVLVTDYRTKLIDVVNGYEVAFFLKINDSVCKNIIKQYFFSEDVTIKLKPINDFVATYLLAYKDDDHFKFVFNIIKAYKELYWPANKTDKLSHLFDFFSRIYYKHIHQDIEFCKLFKTYWEQIFSHDQSFGEYVALRLMVLHNGHSAAEEFSKEVSTLFHELNLEYGPYIDDLLLDCIDLFFSNEVVSNSQSLTRLQLAYYMLKFDLSELNCAIASFLVRGCEKNRMYQEIVAMLKSVDSPSIRIRCNSLFKW